MVISNVVSLRLVLGLLGLSLSINHLYGTINNSRPIYIVSLERERVSRLPGARSRPGGVAGERQVARPGCGEAALDRWSLFHGDLTPR